MRLVRARKNWVMLHDDGVIHYPFTNYISGGSNNPHSVEDLSIALRILYRFFHAHEIELAVRALQGRCLEDNEIKALVGLCYRPLTEVETLASEKVRLIASAIQDKPPEKMKGAVERNTANKRLNHIAHYLKHYWEHVLIKFILNQSLRDGLEKQYTKLSNTLKKQVRGTKQNHHLKIRSLPADKFQQIIKAVVITPELLFLNSSGEPSRTIQRGLATRRASV